MSGRKKEKKMITEWNVFIAIDEIESFADLINEWEKEISEIDRCNQKRFGLIDTQEIISSYAFEVAIKTLVWMDNPYKGFAPIHNLPELYKELKEDTKAGLEQIGITHQELKKNPMPVTSSRYSMEIRHNKKCRNECIEKCKEECQKYYESQANMFEHHPVFYDSKKSEEYKVHKAKCQKECKNQCKHGCKADPRQIVYPSTLLKGLVGIIKKKMESAELLIF